MLRRIQSLKKVIIWRKEANLGVHWFVQRNPFATDMIYSGDLKEVVEKSSEFENSANLKEGSIFNCPIPYIWFDLDEVIEKNAEVKIGTIWKKLMWENIVWSWWRILSRKSERLGTNGEEGCYEVVDRGGFWYLIIQIINCQTQVNIVFIFNFNFLLWLFIEIEG